MKIKTLVELLSSFVPFCKNPGMFDLCDRRVRLSCLTGKFSFEREAI